MLTTHVNPPDTIESELLVISQAAQQITHSSEPERAIHGILRLLSQLLGLNRGRVVLPDERSGELQIRYAYGLTVNEKHKGSYGVGEGITGRVFQTGQMALIQNIDDDPVYLTRAIERTTLPDEAVAFLAVPIIQDEHPVGVLATHRLRNRVRPFQRDLSLLQVLATLIGQVLRVKQLIEERTDQLLSENQLLKNRIESKAAKYGIMGNSAVLQQVIQQAFQVAKTNATVLLLGESGTGKERFARMQHLASERVNGPFIGINCAAIPESLIESELFGHEKGAFTGAAAMKKGKIEMAHGGTLFLDEIGDLGLDLQVKILKVLETRTIQRVGSSKDIAVDVRFIAATHQNLQEAVNEGRFRLDLFYRLNVFPIRLPPLRARHGDIPILANHFLIAANEEYGRKTVFAEGAIVLLEQYQWPGNIRQLENLVKRSVLLSLHDVIDKTLLEQILREEDVIVSPGTKQNASLAVQPDESTLSASTLSAGVDPSSFLSLPASLTQGAYIRPYARVQENEVDNIVAALRNNAGNKTRAAMALGLTPRQLRYRMKKLAIEG